MATLTSYSTSTRSEDIGPSPSNFVLYLPWACKQFGLLYYPLITKVLQGISDNVTDSGAGSRLPVNHESDTKGDSVKYYYYDSSEFVKITAVYDSNDKLVQIKFNKNRYIPREIFKMISLIAPFYEQLTCIYINGGLHYDGVYELSKIITVSKLTEVIIENSSIKEGNYYLMLDSANLKYLSLARCNMNDNTVKELASRLVYGLPASKSLIALSLASNKITDVGAKYLGEMLRSNRQLAYLNLAGNRITDKGAECIMNSLMAFPLNEDEKTDLGKNKLNHLKERIAFMKRPVNQQRQDKRKSIARRKLTTLFDYAKAAESVANSQFEEFKHPFDLDNTVTKGGVVYCLGNNTLCRISLAYNNLSYFSIRRLLNVFNEQSNLNRTPKGLYNVNIEGNQLPDCSELSIIDSMITDGLEKVAQTSSKDKIKTGAKGKK